MPGDGATLSGSAAGTTLELSAIASGEFRCWLGGHLALDTGAKTPLSAQNEAIAVPAVINITVPSAGMLLRCELRGFSKPPYRAQLLARVEGQQDPIPVPSAWLRPQLRASDEQLLAFRNKPLQAGGWNTWENLHMLNFVRLPKAVELRLDLVQKATGETLGDIHVFRRDNPARVQPGLHSLNSSQPFFMEVNVSRWAGVDCLVAFEASSQGLNAGLGILVRSFGDGCSALQLKATGRAEWGRPFIAHMANDGMIFIETPGFGANAFIPVAFPFARNMSADGGAVGFWELGDGTKLGFASEQRLSVLEIE